MNSRNRKVIIPQILTSSILLPLAPSILIRSERPIAKKSGRRSTLDRLGVKGRAVQSGDGGVKGGAAAVHARAVGAHERDELITAEPFALEDVDQLLRIQRWGRDLVFWVCLGAVLAAYFDSDGWAWGTSHHCHGCEFWDT